MKASKAQSIISLATCFFLVLAVTICKENKFSNILPDNEKATEKPNENTGILRQADDGVQIVSTRQIARDINGYGGNVPLEVYMKDNRIIKVVALENAETPSYFAKVRNSGLLKQWDNLSPEEALGKEVDGISGATESSSAIIRSMQKAMEYAKEHSLERAGSSFSFDWMLFLGLLAGIAVCTLLITYFSKQPKPQTMQYVLNVFNLALVIVVTALSIQPKNNQAINKDPIGYPAENPLPKDKWKPENVHYECWTEEE